MTRHTLWMVVVILLGQQGCNGQAGVHQPVVVHYGNARSYQTIQFGTNILSAQPQQVVGRFPARTSGIPQGVPAARQAPLRAVSVQPALKKNYRPDPSTYTYNYDTKDQVTFEYDPANPEKTFDYKYNYDGPKYTYRSADIPLNVPAAQLVDSAIEETKVQGAKIVRVLQKLQNNKLIAKAIESTANTGDPCSVIPSDLDAIVADLIDGITDSRESLVNVIASVQDMKRYEKDTVNVIKSASQAVLAIEPLVPVLQKVFNSDPACDNSIQATINKFDGVGNVLDTLGRTNLVSRNSGDKQRLIQGGRASKAISRTAANLERLQFTRLCSDSPTFTKDVFAGVSELMAGLRDISAAFSDQQNAFDEGKLDQTVQLLKEGAELMADLNFNEFEAERYVAPRNCVTSLPDVAKSLAEVAELVDVIDQDSLKSLGRK